jgi:uncharacterized protein (TIGR00369 family)
MTATAEAVSTDADTTLAAWRAREAEVRAHRVPAGLGRPEQFAGRTGLQIFQAILAGEIPPPPIAALLDIEPVEAEEGRAVFAVTPAEFHYNPIGLVHGGLAATMIDSATGCAVQSTLEPGVLYTSLEVKVNFARPITRDTGRVLCEGTIVHRGSRVATAEGRVLAESDGRLLAHGTTTCLLFSLNGQPR